MRVKLSFENMSAHYDKWFARDSVEIAVKDSKSKKSPANVKSKRDENQPWLEKLAIGSHLDCKDKFNKYYRATITGSRGSVEGVGGAKPTFMFRVGYRMYDDAGDKTDAKGERFFGYSETHDEWHAPTTDKMAPLYSETDPERAAEEAAINDGDDPEDDAVFAVHRGPEHGSSFLVGSINRFGAQGGFDHILALLPAPPLDDEDGKVAGDGEGGAGRDKSDVVDAQFKVHGKQNAATTNATTNAADGTQPSSPPAAAVDTIEMLKVVVDAICPRAPLLSKHFAKRFAPLFYEASQLCVMRLPSRRLRDLKQEEVDACTEALGKLIRRAWAAEMIARNAELFGLALSVQCLHSEFFNSQLTGFKMILSIVKRVGLNQCKYLTKKRMVEWLEEEKIVEASFGSNSNEQIIDRAIAILRFLATNKVLTVAHIALVWDVVISGREVLVISSLKVLKDIVYQYTSEQLQFLAERLLAVEPAQLMPQTLELMTEVARRQAYKVDSKPSAMTLVYRLWDIVVSPMRAQVDDEVAKKARAHVLGLLESFYFKPERGPFLVTLVERLATNSSAPQCLDMIRSVIDQLPITRPKPIVVNLKNIKNNNANSNKIDHDKADGIVTAADAAAAVGAKRMAATDSAESAVVDDPVVGGGDADGPEEVGAESSTEADKEAAVSNDNDKGANGNASNDGENRQAGEAGAEGGGGGKVKMRGQRERRKPPTWGR